MNSFKIEKQQTLIFAKWKRKKYSVFATLKKVVKISVLSVVYLLASPQESSGIEQDSAISNITYDLDEIEVSAQRSPALYSEIARIVSVIEAKEIEAAPAQNIQDLLEYIAGVDVRQRGTEGVQADISIRGGTFDQTLILINGINITDPQTGHHNLNLPVSLEQVERIEVLEGPAAKIYGPNAFSGAINIVTKSPGSNSIIAAVSSGSYNYYNGNLSGGFSTGKLKHLVALGGKSSDGYIKNTDFKVSNLFYSNKFETQKGKLSLNAGMSGKGFGANSFYTPKYPNQYENTKTFFSSLQWQDNGTLHLKPVLYYRRHQDRFELFRMDKYKQVNDSTFFWENDTIHGWSTNHHLTNVIGANVNSWIQWKLGKTAFGVEYRSENILSNVLGEEMNSPKNVPGEDTEFTKSKSRNTLSLFFEHVVYFKNWTFTGGTMGNHISGNKLGWNIFPGLEISNNITDYAKVFLSFNTSLRMPTFTDLYYDGTYNIGNPGLKPEESESLEGGVKLTGRFIRAHLVVFYRDGKNIIDWIRTDTEDEIWQPQNLTRIKSLGSEFQLEYNINKQFGNHFPDKIMLSYFYNNLEKTKSDFISAYVLDNLKHKLVVAFNQKLIENVMLNLRFTYQDREGTFSKYLNVDESIETDYKPFGLLDFKLSYQQRNYSIYFSANNVFNTKYYDIGNVIQPGRWLKFGVSYTLDFY